MRYCIQAWRKDWKLVWAIYQTQNEVFGPDADDKFREICNRPKTPRLCGTSTRGRARVWLARYFRRVSDALFDGATDEEAIKLWINTDATDLGGLKEEMRPEDIALRRLQTVRMRPHNGGHGTFFKAKR
jgi:hypothetical protein